MITNQDFHSQSERHVRQEVFAHCNQIVMTRILTNRGERDLNAERPGDESFMQVNVKSSLAAMAREIEALPLRQPTLVDETVNRILRHVYDNRQMERPNRSYARRSRESPSTNGAEAATTKAQIPGDAGKVC